MRATGDEVVIIYDQGHGAVEVARHRLLRPGQASILDEHYQPRSQDPLHKEPRPTNPAEAAFLAIGEGAKAWLIEAAALGTRRIEARMAVAVALARVIDVARVDQALGLAAVAGR